MQRNVLISGKVIAKECTGVSHTDQTQCTHRTHYICDIYIHFFDFGCEHKPDMAACEKFKVQMSQSQTAVKTFAFIILS